MLVSVQAALIFWQTKQEAIEYMEYAATTNPAIASAWLNFFEGKRRC